MKILLSSFGSAGDFNPFLALGRALKKAGHEVLFLANPYYRNIIEGAGLRFVAVGEYVDLFQLLERDSRFLDQKKGPRALVEELVIPGVRTMFPAAVEVIKRENIDLVISHLLEMGGIFAALQLSVPYCILMTTPMAWMSVEKPGYHGHMQAPGWLHRTAFRFFVPLFTRILQYKFSKVCNELSVPAIYGNWRFLFSNARLNFGAWSPTLRSAAADDPPRSFVCGYFRDEHIKKWEDIPKEIEEFFSQPEKPVVVGMGSTVAVHGDKIYDNIVPACKDLSRPLMLIGPNLERYNDPENRIVTASFAPFGWVFPRASVVVHHGGINTTGEALRAGVPAAVVPFGYDQFDNAIKVEKLNAGRKLKLEKLSPHLFKETISELIANPAVQNKMIEISQAIKAEPDGSMVAVQKIEEYA